MLGTSRNYTEEFLKKLMLKAVLLLPHAQTFKAAILIYNTKALREKTL